MTDIAPNTGVLDDVVSAFQIEGLPVRGRVVRLGAAVDEVLTRHDYPEPVANLLGEACALAALVVTHWLLEGRSAAVPAVLEERGEASRPKTSP